jgi:hypothetical protein
MPRFAYCIVPAFAILSLTAFPDTARADEPNPAPYSLPWQLRPVTAGTAVRSDTSFARYENNNAQGGFAVASELLASYRVPGTGDHHPGTGLAPVVKLTVVDDSPPANGTGGFAFVNPLVGAAYALVSGPFRVNGFFAFTLPVGMGGGNTPDKGALDARTVGPFVRAGMDNALFAVNDFTLIPGIDVAYVAGGLTLQGEVTLFQLERVRGEKQQLEAQKTNFTSGVHAGYFLTSQFSIGIDLHYQRWLDPPFAVEDHKTGTSLDLVSLGVGPRLHAKLAPGIFVHPGIAYVRGFDAPMSRPGNYNIIQLDIPVSF